MHCDFTTIASLLGLTISANASAVTQCAVTIRRSDWRVKYSSAQKQHTAPNRHQSNPIGKQHQPGNSQQPLESILLLLHCPAPSSPAHDSATLCITPLTLDVTRNSPPQLQSLWIRLKLQQVYVFPPHDRIASVLTLLAQ